MAENERVLVVDDENLILKIISDILLKEGYEVKTAFNCEKALQLLREYSVQVVLTDIRMPEKNGIDLLEEVRNFNPDIPVIIMTGYASLVTAVEAVRHGAFDYLTKPLDVERLRDFCDFAATGLRPALTLLLDLPPELGLQRRRRAFQAAAPSLPFDWDAPGQTSAAPPQSVNRMENRPPDFHQRVREGFRREAERDPRRIVVLDASRSVRQVQQEILRVVRARLASAGGSR